MGAAKDAVSEQKEALRIALEAHKLLESLNASLGEECSALKEEAGRLMAQQKDLAPREELLKAVPKP